MDLTIIAGILAGAFTIWYLYDNIYVRNQKKKMGKLINILLFEKVGKDLKYMGNFVGEEKYEVDGLGAYLYLGGKMKKSIERITNDDYLHDSKYGKALQVIKFSDDDYRPMARLKEETWFKNIPIKIPVYEEDGVNDDGEPVYKFDDEGNKIQAKDEKGNLLFSYEDNLVEFKEPFGVSQSAREAMRFSVSYAKKMSELKKAKLGLLERFAPVMAVIIIAVVLGIAFIKMTDKNSETQMYIADSFVKGAENYNNATSNPLFAEKVMDYFNKEKVENGAPPK